MVHDNFDDVVKDIKKLPAKEKIKYYIEFIKLVLPRPVNTEELEAIAGASRSALVAKLFLDGNGEG
jgi:hypothetical protein